MVSNKFKLRNQKGFAHLVLVLVVGVVVVVGLVLASGDGGKLGVFAGKGGNRGKPPKQSPEPKQSVTVQTPNGGESYEVGDTLKMRWTVTEYSQYSQETSYVLLATRVTEPDGSYSYNDQIQIASNVNMKNRKNSLDWVIPETVPNGDRYVIIVGINASNLDYSDGVFTIINSAVSTPEPTPTPLPTTNPTPTPGPVSSLCDNSTGTVEVKVPNGGESYEVGDTVLLKWCVNNYSEYSQQYSKIWLAARSTQSSGSFVYRNQVEIANDLLMTAGENTLNWGIPNTVLNGGAYVILVSINNFNPNFDYSDGSFTINNP